jgi:hypothetical protein
MILVIQLPENKLIWFLFTSLQLVKNIDRLRTYLLKNHNHCVNGLAINYSVHFHLQKHNF